MSDRLTPVPNPHGSQLSARPVSRTEVVDAAARVITRRGDHRVRWAAIAYEAGNAQAVLGSQWFEDLAHPIDECYARTAQGLSDSLLSAETAPGTALDKVAAFMVAALESPGPAAAYPPSRPGANRPQ